MIFSLHHVIDSLAGMLTGAYPDYPVYDSPNQQGTSFPCFFLFFIPSTIEEHVGNHYFRDLGVDLVFVQQRNLVNGNRKIHEIAEFLDRNLDPFPYTDGSGESVPVPVQDQQWSIEDEELHYQFHIRTRILVEETENLMQEMEENNVGIKENDLENGGKEVFHRETFEKPPSCGISAGFRQGDPEGTGIHDL